MNTAATHYAVDPLPGDERSRRPRKRRTSSAARRRCGASGWVGDDRLAHLAAHGGDRRALLVAARARDVDDMYRRLAIVSMRLEELGLTHTRNGRRVAATPDEPPRLAPLHVLAGVVEPVKGYQRGRQQPGMTTLRPLTHLVDAVSTDSAGAREVTALVDGLLSDAPRFMLGRDELHAALSSWRDEHAGLHALIDRGAGARGSHAARRRSGGDGRDWPRRARRVCRRGIAPDTAWRDARIAALDSGCAAEGRARVSVRARPARARVRRRRAGQLCGDVARRVAPAREDARDSAAAGRGSAGF